MSISMNRIPLVAFALVLLAVLGLASTQVAFAQIAEEGEELQGLVGEVIDQAADGTLTMVAEDGSGVIVIKNPDGGEFVITLPAGYELRTPGAPAPTNVAGVLEVGANVAVLTAPDDQGGLVAQQVLVKPTKPTAPPVTGAVVSRDGNVITIMKPDGTSKTIELPAGAQAPEEGEIVTAFVPEDADGGGRPASTGLVRAEEVTQRLSRHLDEQLEDREAPELPEQAQQALDDRIARLAGLLEQHSARNVEALDRVLALPNLPAAARAGLDRARGNAERGAEAAQSHAKSARERAELPEDAGRPENPGGGRRR